MQSQGLRIFLSNQVQLENLDSRLNPHMFKKNAFKHADLQSHGTFILIVFELNDIIFSLTDVN